MGINKHIIKYICKQILFFSSSRLCECACMCVVSWKERCHILPCSIYFQWVMKQKIIKPTKSFIFQIEPSMQWCLCKSSVECVHWYISFYMLDVYNQQCICIIKIDTFRTKYACVYEETLSRIHHAYGHAHTCTEHITRIGWHLWFDSVSIFVDIKYAWRNTNTMYMEKWIVGLT